MLAARRSSLVQNGERAQEGVGRSSLNFSMRYRI
jgi:hypothetical protein